MLETRVMLVLDRLLKNTHQSIRLSSQLLARFGCDCLEEGATSLAFFILVLLSYGLFLGGLTMTLPGHPL